MTKKWRVWILKPYNYNWILIWDKVVGLYLFYASSPMGSCVRGCIKDINS